MSASVAALEALAVAWRAERATQHARFAAMRAEAPLAERVRRGLALADCAIIDEASAGRGRMRLRLAPRHGLDADALHLRPGEPVCLWRDRLDGPDTVSGVLGDLDGKSAWITVDREPVTLEARYHVDAVAPDTTFQRGDTALARWTKAPSPHRRALRDVLWGDTVPGQAAATRWQPFDAGLDEVQRQAVELGLRALDLALVHGPPGTGKTRTLVELIRQRLGRGERVLVTAPSNAAVDHLGERLLAVGVRVVRVGHPARVHPSLAAHTLDAQVEADGALALAQAWRDRAQALRRTARGPEGRTAYAEARALERDAWQEIANAETRLLARVPVVLATCSGADHPALADLTFDAVCIDEATQAVDPLALVALGRAPVAILAGDPAQLGPTVLTPRSPLTSPLFERAIARHPGAGVMLEVQHRMHAEIMAFPSHMSYGGRLRAAPAVAGHTLADLGVQDDPGRPTPCWLVDTAGTGWQEAAETRAGFDPSTFNLGHADRVAAEVRRLISRGVAPAAIAVITTYRAQVRQLRARLADLITAGLAVDTVDAFQGREREVVVVDTVRSNDHGQVGFLADTRRMNVALTRARRQLLVIGDSVTLGHHRYYQALLTHLEAHGGLGSAWADDAGPL